MRRKVRVLNYSGSGIETTFTQGEDACLAAMVPVLPKPMRASCWWSAPCPMWWRTSSAGCFAEDGHRPGAFPARAQAPPRCRRRSGPTPSSVLAQPFLGETACRCWKARRDAHRGAVPAWREGTTAWLAPPRDAFGVDRRRFEDVTAPRARARRCRRAGEKLDGKSVFFFPDSQLEIPLARFLTRECGMEAVEVGTPYPAPRHHGARARPAARGPSRISEGQDVERSSTAAAPRGPTSPSAASASPTRWRPKG
jgi:light-independent protochlorophyllide reductase subunit N